MTTNGVLLDKHMDFLVKQNFTLLISLDGDNEANGYRVDKGGQRSFASVISNIEKLRNSYPSYYQSNVEFNSVVHNKNSVETIMNFFAEKFNKTPELAELSDIGINPGKKDEFLNIYRNISDSFHQSQNCEILSKKAFLFCPDIYIVLRYIEAQSQNVYWNYTELLKHNEKSRSIHTGTCVPFSRKMFITVNGKILPCERIPQEHSFGVVSDTSFTLDCDQIAKMHNSNLKKMEQTCSLCGNNTSCLQCIYQIDQISSGNRKCPNQMTALESKKHVRKCLEYIQHHPELYQLILTDTRYKDIEA